MLFWPAHRTGVGIKLLPKWDGPYQILERLNEVYYRLDNGNRLLAVHVERLRKSKIQKPANNPFLFLLQYVVIFKLIL
jgi:hypothetical protein